MEGKILIQNQTDQGKMKNQVVTLLSDENDVNKEQINISLTSIQNCLNNIVRQFNKMSEPQEEVSFSLSKEPDETWKINISGVAEKATEDQSGNNIENTYFKNDYMTVDEDSGTLYIK